MLYPQERWQSDDRRAVHNSHTVFFFANDVQERNQNKPPPRAGQASLKQNAPTASVIPAPHKQLPILSLVARGGLQAHATSPEGRVEMHVGSGVHIGNKKVDRVRESRMRQVRLARDGDPKITASHRAWRW